MSGDQYTWQGLLPIEINHMIFDILLFTPIPQQRLTSPNLTWHTVDVITFVATNKPLSSEFFHFIIQDSIQQCQILYYVDSNTLFMSANELILSHKY